MILVSVLANVTPTPEAETQVVRELSRAADSFNNMTYGMASLFVIMLVIGVVMVLVLANRNSLAQTYNLMTRVNAQKDEELTELRKIHGEALGKIDQQMQAANKLSAEANKILTAVNDRGSERDTVQTQLATDIHTLVSAGSKPVQTILERVQETAGKVALIDARTADWTTILQQITPLLAELVAVRQEAQKHITKPIPNVPPLGENGVPPPTEA